MGQFKMLVSRAQIPALVSHTIFEAGGVANGQIKVNYSSISTAGGSSDRSHEQVVSFETHDAFLLKRVSTQKTVSHRLVFIFYFFFLDLRCHVIAC
jgi:hypothetical protein